ncbi:MAG: histidine phosphotransferase family protein [Octadecabacter sp.]
MSNLTALLCSRICHDLINPLGAIGNGIELLGMTDGAPGPEMALVNESVGNATARVKFMRLAFGAATADQTVYSNDILTTLQDVTRGSRLRYDWNVAGDPKRLDLRVALQSMMCVETALPMGGEIEVTLVGNVWRIKARNDRLNLDPALWAPLSKGNCPENLIPAQVQFGLLPETAFEAGRTLALNHGADWVTISF